MDNKIVDPLQRFISKEIKNIEDQNGKVHQIENQSKIYFIEIDPMYGWKGRGQDITLRDEKWIPIKTFPNKGSSAKKDIIEYVSKFLIKEKYK